MNSLPAYTAESANGPLPRSVGTAAVQLAEAVARVLGDSYRNRPGQALEWIAEKGGSVADRELRDISVAAQQWLNHPMFARQFAATLAAADTGTDATGTEHGILEQTMAGDLGSANTSTEHAWHVPATLSRETAIDAIARTIARSYGCTMPTSSDVAAATDVVDHFSVLVGVAAYDGRIVHTATPMTAMNNLARLLGPHGAATDALNGTNG